VDTTGFTNIVVSWAQRHSGTASKYVRFQTAPDGYSFTDSDLAWAVVKAQQRGVRVRVYLDDGQAAGRYAKGRFLEKRGVAVRYYHGEGLMHHKFAVLDGQQVITGSYNWSASAEERNKENALVFTGRAYAAAYTAEFEKLWRRP
jgi:phosphatidylserine/phosphatidylglycerophosphate/cardiolipin synthase-like enzyme